MKISEIHINSFGKLENFTWRFDEGMNLFYRDNEFGKSTMLSFIRAMFYGFSGRSTSRLRDNDRKRFIPWGGKSFGGSMTFTHEGKSYLLEKTFLKRKADDKVSLSILPSGDKIALAQKEVGEHLFNISEAEFVNTVFVGQLASNILGTEKDTENISARLANLEHSGNEVYSYDEIKGRLSNATSKLQALRGDGGLISQLTTEINQLADQNQKLDEVQEQVDLMDAQVNNWRYQVAQSEAEIEQLDSNLQGQILRKEASQAKFNQVEVSLQTALQKKQFYQEQLTLKVQLELQRQLEKATMLQQYKDHVLQSEILRQQFSDEMEQAQQEIDQKMEEDRLAAELVTQLQIKNQQTLEEQTIRCQESKTINEQKQLEYEMHQRNILSLVDQRQSLRMARQEVKKKGTVRMFRISFPARVVVISLLLASILSLIMFIVGQNMFWRLGGIFLILAAVLIASYGWQITKLDRKVQLLTDQYDTAVVLFGQVSTELQKLNEDLNRDRQELERLTLEKENIFHRATKEALHRAAIIALSKERFLFAKAQRDQVAEVDGLYTLTEDAGGESSDSLEPDSNANVLDTMEDSHSALEEDILVHINTKQQLIEEMKRLTEEIAVLTATITQKRDQISEINMQIFRQEGQRETLYSRLPSRSWIAEEQAMLNERLSRAQAYYKALEIAKNVMDAAFVEMEKYFAPQVNQRAGEYLSYLTAGGYGSVHIDRSFAIQVATKGDYDFQSADFFSGGTVDQIYFALRLAVADLIYSSDDQMPLLLDDSFVQYDDKRALQALRLMKELAGNRQVVLFTCHGRMTDLYQQLDQQDKANM